MGNKLIYTCVSGEYSGYTELFYASCKRAYPDAEVAVDRLTTTRTKYQAACQRFLTSLGEYDEVYITDIDMIHMKSALNLWDFHRAEAGDNCYSNSVRGGEEKGPDRLTGLHYCKQGWWSATADARKKYQDMLDRGFIGDGKIDDELMLKRIADESGLPTWKFNRALFLRHCGIHLGTIRDFRGRGTGMVFLQLHMRVSPVMRDEWLEIAPEMMACCRDKTVEKELRTLTMYCERYKV